MNQNFDCHGDCSKCGDGFVIPYKGPTPRCSRCGVPMILKGEGWVCWKCGGTEQKPLVEIVLPTRKTTPQEELERSQKNIRRSKGLDEPTVLTVGDLSYVKRDEREHRVEDGMKRLENLKQGLSVGDLTSKDNDKRGLDQLYAGPAVPQSYVSESEEIKMAMMAKRRKAQEEVFRIKQIMFEQQREKELRREAHAKGIDL